MAEEILLQMGSHEFAYMGWAADKAAPALQRRIHQVMTAIKTGARPNPHRWPTDEACLSRLHDADEVVAIMAAQMLGQMRGCKYHSIKLDSQKKIQMMLADVAQRPWFVRYGLRTAS
ncbi:MAG: hypothetical protein WAU91_18175 [Desulfatitalea sp.]